jgi:polyisoprenoid-binding protein YceI
VVHVSKSGLFSAFGDNHEVEAPISEGSVDEKRAIVTLVIETARMRVLDPQLAPGKRQQVQDRMLGPDVLDISHFPKISFESTKVTPGTNDTLTVAGRLSIHGVTQPVLLKVRSEAGRYQGTCTIKQREFGITPVTVAGGTVRVKDELKIDFEIRTR